MPEIAHMNNLDDKSNLRARDRLSAHTHRKRSVWEQSILG